MKDNNFIRRLYLTYQINDSQVSFGRYSAELSFFIIFAIFPLMLALANVISILPFSETEILSLIEGVLPLQVKDIVIDLLSNYLQSTSSGVFSLGLLISLWPASNVFNTLQRLLNTIYKAGMRQNFVVSRLFAYIFTVLLVAGTIFFTFFIVFGEQILLMFNSLFDFYSGPLLFLSQQGQIIGTIASFVVILSIYHFMPNVKRSIKYAIPGSIFTFVGIILVTQLFPIYINLTGRNFTQEAIGVFIIFIIWLYLNGYVISIGAYINAFMYDLLTKSYEQLLEETKSNRVFKASSQNYKQHTQFDNRMIYNTEVVEGDESNGIN